MTITEPAAAAEPIEVPDADAPSVGTRRVAAVVVRGWHVRLDGRWLLVDKAEPVPGAGLAIWFDGGAMLTCNALSVQWTRNPAEQIAYIASVLPAREHYKPPRKPMATLFGGSASSPLVG